jgi:hypothetical protein
MNISASAKQAPAAHSGLVVLAFIETLLITIPLGSMLFFSFAVAPSAFSVLPSRHLAGQLVTSVISKLEWLIMIAGLLLISVTAFTWRLWSGRVGKAVRVTLVAAMVAMAAASRYLITPRMVSLRSAMGRIIDDVPANDPLRVEFNGLHQVSVGLMGLAMLSGLIVLFLTVRLWVRR